MDKKVQDMVLGLSESHIDIESAELLTFHEKWHQHRADIPIDFIDFMKINLSIREYSIEALGDWKQKLTPSKELEKALGILAGIIDPFVDYVNTLRRTLILQYLHTLTTTGYLDVVLDADGKETYVEKTEEFNYEAVAGFIRTVLEAKENHLG